MPDAHANFAYSTVATAPSPATSGTSLVVAAGEGTRFPDPASVGSYNCTIWPISELPTPANAEIVRVTAKSTDTLTIDRAEEGSGARTVIVGDQIAMTVTAKVLTDIEGAIGRVKLDESIVGAGGAASVTFSSIPAGYRNLVLTGVVRAEDSGVKNILMRLNADSGTNYQHSRWNRNGSSNLTGQTAAQIGSCPGSDATAGYPGTFDITIPGYSRTVFNKSWAGRAAETGTNVGEVIEGLWVNTAAITSITVLLSAGDLLEGSHITLYADID